MRYSLGLALRITVFLWGLGVVSGLDVFAQTQHMDVIVDRSGSMEGFFAVPNHESVLGNGRLIEALEAAAITSDLATRYQFLPRLGTAPLSSEGVKRLLRSRPEGFWAATTLLSQEVNPPPGGVRVIVTDSIQSETSSDQIMQERFAVALAQGSRARRGIGFVGVRLPFQGWRDAGFDVTEDILREIRRYVTQLCRNAAPIPQVQAKGRRYRIVNPCPEVKGVIGIWIISDSDDKGFEVTRNVMDAVKVRLALAPTAFYSIPKLRSRWRSQVNAVDFDADRRWDPPVLNHSNKQDTRWEIVIACPDDKALGTLRLAAKTLSWAEPEIVPYAAIANFRVASATQYLEIIKRHMEPRFQSQGSVWKVPIRCDKLSSSRSSLEITFKAREEIPMQRANRPGWVEQMSSDSGWHKPERIPAFAMLYDRIMDAVHSTYTDPRLWPLQEADVVVNLRRQ